MVPLGMIVSQRIAVVRVRAGEVGVDQRCLAEVGVGEIGATEGIRGAEVGLGEPGSGQVGRTQIGAVKDARASVSVG